MKANSDDYWRLVKELDKRYEKRQDLNVQPVPDKDYGESTRPLLSYFVALMLGILLIAMMFIVVGMFGG